MKICGEVCLCDSPVVERSSRPRMIWSPPPGNQNVGENPLSKIGEIPDRPSSPEIGSAFSDQKPFQIIARPLNSRSHAFSLQANRYFSLADTLY